MAYLLVVFLNLSIKINTCLSYLSKKAVFTEDFLNLKEFYQKE